jgi:hypothetical protein
MEESLETPVIPVQQRVAAGIERLDEHLGPDWPLRIDLDRFRIESETLCVLGQLFGSYDLGRGTLFADELAQGPEICDCCHPVVTQLCQDLGFLWHSAWDATESLIAEQDALNAAWNAAITLLQVERQPRDA